MCMGTAVGPHPCFSTNHRVYILIGAKQQLTVVPIRISLMTNEAEHLFTHLFVSGVSFLGKYLFKSFPHFLNCGVFCLIVEF